MSSLWWKYFQTQSCQYCWTFALHMWYVFTQCIRWRGYINWVSNKNEIRQSFSNIIKTIFPSFYIPSTLKSLFKKQKCKKCLFEFINVPMAKKQWCWYNIKQYYPESICFKYWSQRKGVRMFDKMRKAKKVEIQNRTVIPVLICCFFNISQPLSIQIFCI